jgi:probable phosphoglycerate mutase
MLYQTIYVLRHGETEWNAEGRFQGALNSPLTEKGRAQAARQAALLSQLDLSAFDVRVSPQGRAFETAAIALARLVPFLRTDDRLREIEVGEWSGQLRKNLSVTGETLVDTPDGPLALYEHAPGGEGFAALRERCEAFLASLERPTICVTHGITSRMLRSVALGIPAAQLGDLPGGQGVVHIVENEQHRTLE